MRRTFSSSKTTSFK